jgi:hypothetical protein
MLPSGPLPEATKYTVTIQNNGINPVVLSDPEVNANGVKVELSERLPGREFNVTVSFPAGFESTFSVQATVKSNNPKCPSVTIPVYQPAATPQPQGGHAAAQPASAAIFFASRK